MALLRGSPVPFQRFGVVSRDVHAIFVLIRPPQLKLCSRVSGISTATYVLAKFFGWARTGLQRSCGETSRCNEVRNKYESDSYNSVTESRMNAAHTELYRRRRKRA
jgi:hypothetical protein